jgi:hypothetical protein
MGAGIYDKQKCSVSGAFLFIVKIQFTGLIANKFYCIAIGILKTCQAFVSSNIGLVTKFHGLGIFINGPEGTHVIMIRDAGFTFFAG